MKMSMIQCVGIDISKDSFTACLCTREGFERFHFTNVEQFSNDKKGFNRLMRWSRKHSVGECSVGFLMEATGVYHERLAYHLHKIKQEVYVVLPNKSHHYFRSLNVKSKNDEIDAAFLARFGVDRNHHRWQPADPVLVELRNLTRYLLQLKQQRTSLKNIRHSKEHSAEMQAFILKSNQRLIKHLDKECTACQTKIKHVIESTQWLSEKVSKILTIKGIGLTTVATIIAETKGFKNISNAKQLASYAGYDVVERSSGTSVTSKTRISKKGNSYIRGAMFFPAMVAIQHNPELRANYLRIINKTPFKMVGQVAIQRKLLLLIYALWKKDEIYNPQYKHKAAQSNQERAARDRSVADLPT